jgi:formate-dependent nitrite reductase membrane component NrfD
MNPFVTDPEWGHWIVAYFFLGGIAAGCYFVATLIDLVGHPEDRGLARLGYLVAFPLICLCGLLLTIDLNQPQRFWHMLFRSEVVHEALNEGWPLSGRSWGTMVRAPLLKYWSPMSIGSWALTVFGLCSWLSFLGSVWPEGRMERLFRESWFARVLQVVGCLVGFFVASYTGALLTATNQPVWSDTTWVAPLFLASAASTGLAVLTLLAHYRRTLSAEAVHRLTRADLWSLVLELVVFLVFLGSLGPLLASVWDTKHGKALLIVVPLVGILLPLVLHLRLRSPVGGWAMAAAVLALVGGLVLRYGLIYTPPELLARAPKTAPRAAAPAVIGDPHAALIPHFSPEDGRPPENPGADPNNRAGEVQPRSKVFNEE